MFDNRPIGSLTIDELRSVDTTGMSADELLDLAVLQGKVRDVLAATMERTLVAFESTYEAAIGCSASSEYGPAVQITDAQAANELWRARIMDSTLRRVRDAQEAGEISARHTAAIRRAFEPAFASSSVEHAETEAATLQAVEDLAPLAVDYARTHTVKQTAREVGRWLKVGDTATAQQRHERELKKRSVYYETTDDGLGRLTIEGNPVFVYLIYLCICAAGDYDKSKAEPGDTRTRANFRADAAIGVLYDATRPREIAGLEDAIDDAYNQMLRSEARQAILGVPLLPTKQAEDLSPWHWNRSRQLQKLIYGSVGDDTAVAELRSTADAGALVETVGADGTYSARDPWPDEPDEPDEPEPTVNLEDSQSDEEAAAFTDLIDEEPIEPDPDPSGYDPEEDSPREMLPRQRREVSWGAPATGKLRRTGAAPIRISIVMDDATLEGRADNPAVVDGQFTITADAARQLLSSADFQRMLVDRNAGTFIEKSAFIYEPSRELRETVNLEHMTCQKPNCDKPAHRCDFDHRVPFNHEDPAAGGLTTRENGGPLCRGDHLDKTNKFFDIVDVPGGQLFYVTPLGRRYAIELPDHRPGKLPAPTS